MANASFVKNLDVLVPVKDKTIKEADDYEMSNVGKLFHAMVVGKMLNKNLPNVKVRGTPEQLADIKRTILTFRALRRKAYKANNIQELLPVFEKYREALKTYADRYGVSLMF